MNKEHAKRLVTAAIFLALGMALPFLTAGIKEVGDSLLPMHLPVFLCGLICSWRYGLAVGLLVPLLRGLLFGMPPLYPNALWMAAELATYGLTVGLLYPRLRFRGGLPLSLVSAMLAGRIVWGITKAALLGVGEGGFTLAAFWVGGFLDAIPGIVLQLLLIPPIVALARKYG